MSKIINIEPDRHCLNAQRVVHEWMAGWSQDKQGRPLCKLEYIPLLIEAVAEELHQESLRKESP